MMNNATQIRFFHVNFATPIEEIKRQYLQLCKEHHPDLGGSVEDMAQINAEYDYLCKFHSHIHESANGGTYEKYDEDNQEIPADFINLISHLVTLRGITVEVVGRFVWVGGNTYANKDEIKGLGMKWSKPRKMWYYSPTPYKHVHSDLDYDEIKAKYGCSFSTSTRDFNRICA